MATKTKARATTMAEFAEAISGHYRGKGSRHVTLWRVDLVHSLLADGAGVRTAAELGRADIVRRFDEALTARYKAGSIQWRATTALFYAILRRGHKLGILPAIPELPSIPHASASPRGEKSSPPPERDVDALFRHVNRAGTWKEERFRVLIYLVGDAGLNVAHACQLEVANVDVASRVIVTGFKGKRPKRLKISPELASALEAWIPKTGGKWLLPGGRRIGPWWHTSRWRHSPLGEQKVACLAIGVEPFTFQQLRRFRAENRYWRPPAEAAPAADRPEPATSAGPPLPVIRLGRPGEPFNVDGKEKPRLTALGYKLLAMLLEAGAEGKTKGQLDAKLGKGGGWRRTFRDLKSDPDLDRILVPAGKSWTRYRALAVLAT